MQTVSTLNLIGVVSPFCLMEFKSALVLVGEGQMLEVLIQDPSVVEDLVRLVEHSNDRLVELKKEGNCYHLVVLRSVPADRLPKEDA